MSLSASAEILAAFGMLVSVGVAFARMKILPANSSNVLNRLVLNLCLPASVLLSVPRLHFDWGLIGIACIPLLLTLVAVPSVCFCSRVLGLRRDQHAVVLLCVVLMNAGFLGYPMVRALLGEEALPYAVIYDQFGAFILLTTFGLFVVAFYSGDRPPTGMEMVRRILKFPPLWSLLFAVTLMPEQPPAWVSMALTRLSDAMLPLVMVTIGLSLRLRLSRSDLKPLGITLVLKLLVMPAVALPMAWAFDLESMQRQVAVLESAMPTMTTVVALTSAYQLAPRLAVSLVSYTILVSLITLPLWTWVIR